MTILMYHQILCFFPNLLISQKWKIFFWEKVYFLFDFFEKQLES